MGSRARDVPVAVAGGGRGARARTLTSRTRGTSLFVPPLLPYFAIAPSLTVEAGHYFETNAATKLEQRGVAIDASVRPVLERFGYTFANAQVGLELGHPNWFVLYVRAGIRRLWYTPRGANDVAQAQVDASSTTRVTIADPSLRAQFPEAKVGLLFFIH